MSLERGWAEFKNIAIDLLKVKALFLNKDFGRRFSQINTDKIGGNPL